MEGKELREQAEKLIRQMEDKKSLSMLINMAHARILEIEKKTTTQTVYAKVAGHPTNE